MQDPNVSATRYAATARHYTCAGCSVKFVGAGWVEGTVVESKKVFDGGEQVRGLGAKAEAAAREAQAEFHPNVSCPSCGAVPDEVRRFHRSTGAWNAFYVGILLAIAAGYVTRVLQGRPLLEEDGGRWWPEVLACVSVLGLSTAVGWIAGRECARGMPSTQLHKWEKLLAEHGSEASACAKLLEGNKAGAWPW